MANQNINILWFGSHILKKSGSDGQIEPFFQKIQQRGQPCAAVSLAIGWHLVTTLIYFQLLNDMRGVSLYMKFCLQSRLLAKFHKIFFS